MKISLEGLQELKTLLHEDYPNTEFTDDELLEIALNLLRNVKLVYGDTLSNHNIYQTSEN